MGTESTDYSWLEHSRPVHRVSVSTFYMGKYEVTQAQWRAVMGSDPSHFTGDNRPVEQVNWDDAKAFCAALGAMTGYAIRLPSESEWEYACRAGTTTEYYFGNDELLLGDYAWYSGNSGSETHPVGQKTPNAWGLYDVSGNVSEWCEDPWHDNYEGAPTDGSVWATGGDSNIRILRGGAWWADAGHSRSAYHYRGGASTRGHSLGLRVAAGTE